MQLHNLADDCQAEPQAVMTAGVTRAHSLITGNVAVSLHAAARRNGCEAHTSAFFISGGSTSGFLAASDVFVRCGPLDDDARLAEDPAAVPLVAPAPDTFLLPGGQRPLEARLAHGAAQANGLLLWAR